MKVVVCEHPSNVEKHTFDAENMAEAVKNYLKSQDGGLLADGEFWVYARSEQDPEWRVFRCLVTQVISYKYSVRKTGETRPIETPDIATT